MEGPGFDLLSFFQRVERAFTTILNEYSDTQREEILKKSICELRVDDSNIDELHDTVKLLIRSAATSDMSGIKLFMTEHNVAYNHLLDFMASFIYLKDTGWVYEIEREFAVCGYLLYGVTPEQLINIDFGEAA